MFARYLLVWLLLAVVTIANGVMRQFVYAHSMSALAAHQLSTLTAIVASGVVVWLVQGRWPLQTRSQAWSIGMLWLLLTIAFEFGFGHYVAGHEWRQLLADYNLLQGRLWSLFLAWMAVLPWVVFTLRKTKRAP